MPNIALAKAVSEANRQARENYAEELDLAAKHKWFTDPMPLTVELIETELGKPYEPISWNIACHRLRWCDAIGCALVSGITLKTLGQLRQMREILNSNAAKSSL